MLLKSFVSSSVAGSSTGYSFIINVSSFSPRGSLHRAKDKKEMYDLTDLPRKINHRILCVLFVWQMVRKLFAFITANMYRAKYKFDFLPFFSSVAR